MKLYRANVGTQVGENGVGFWIDSADAIEVNGQLYADPHRGRVLIEKGVEWHETREAAIRAAAATVTGLASALLKQAEQLREEAAGV